MKGLRALKHPSREKQRSAPRSKDSLGRQDRVDISPARLDEALVQTCIVIPMALYQIVYRELAFHGGG
jgi:hypothetical protein